MDVSCETSTNPMNIYNNLPVRHHHHDDVSQQRLLSQHHPYPHQTPLGQYDDDTSSSGHSEAVAMWEKDRQQSQNGNNEPSFYMVQDNITSHHPRQQHHYYYTDNVNSRTPSTAPLSLIYNNSLTSTTNRNFLETVESPLFIESTGNRHQQTNITTNKESLKHNDDRVSNTIYTKKSGIQCEQNYLNEFKDNGTQSCKNDVAMTDGDTPKKEDKDPFYTDKKADVTNHHTIDHISNGNQPSHKLPVATERRRQRRESHNAVERRRRNNINDNIKLLGELLPENICQGKQNKGSILKGSVLYIHMLNDQLSRYKERVERLEYEALDLQATTQ